MVFSHKKSTTAALPQPSFETNTFLGTCQTKFGLKTHFVLVNLILHNHFSTGMVTKNETEF